MFRLHQRQTLWRIQKQRESRYHKSSNILRRSQRPVWWPDPTQTQPFPPDWLPYDGCGSNQGVLTDTRVNPDGIDPCTECQYFEWDPHCGRDPKVTPPQGVHPYNERATRGCWRIRKAPPGWCGGDEFTTGPCDQPAPNDIECGTCCERLRDETGSLNWTWVCGPSGESYLLQHQLVLLFLREDKLLVRLHHLPFCTIYPSVPYTPIHLVLLHHLPVVGINYDYCWDFLEATTKGSLMVVILKYYEGDTVTYEGQLFVALRDTTTGGLGINGPDWESQVADTVTIDKIEDGAITPVKQRDPQS